MHLHMHICMAVSHVFSCPMCAWGHKSKNEFPELGTRPLDPDFFTAKTNLATRASYKP